MFYLLFYDIQLPCIISTPNGERLNGCIRQCFTTGQYATQHWKSSAARLFLTLPSAQQPKTVSFTQTQLKLIDVFGFLLIFICNTILANC